MGSASVGCGRPRRPSRNDEWLATDSTGTTRAIGIIVRSRPGVEAGMVSAMATEKEVLRINGHEVTVTNPRKVYFPETGHTKLDLVRYYQAVAPGALRGAGGRPMALKRFVDGAAGQPFFQKRAPENLPEFIRTATLTFPSGRTADEVVIDDAAGLAWVANLGCIDLNPHPVRAEDLDHPDELRVDLDPVPGIAWPQIREVALAARESLEAVGLVGWPKTSGSRGHPHQRPDRAALDVPGGPPGGAGPRARRRAPRPARGHVQVVEGGAPRRVPRLQPERQGPDRRLRLFGPAAARRAGVDAARLGRGARPSRPRRSRSTRSRPALPRSAIPATASTTRSDRSRRCWS